MTNALNRVNYFQADYLAFYTGPERRIERRRAKSNERIDTLIKNFGLEQRIRQNRRQLNTSWLLTSK